MPAPLHRRLLTAIRSSGFFQPGDCAGVAVSGGGDSVALLFLLDELKQQLGLRLAVLHFNHLLRGQESDADEQFTAGLARQLALPFYRQSQDAAAVARGASRNLEETARELRYAFFQRMVAQGLVTRVATAHTLDDQAETVLGRILRGTGLTGLAAVREVRGVVVRPLLTFRRQELRQWLASRGLAWREDATNHDPRRLRSRLRHSLLPLLAREYSPSIPRRLAGLAILAQEDECFWQSLLDDCFRRYAHSTTGNSIQLEASDLLSPLDAIAGPFSRNPPLAQRSLAGRLVVRIVQALAPGGRLGAKHIHRVLELAASGVSGDRLHLPQGVLVRREFGAVIFSLKQPGTPKNKETAELRTAYEYTVELPQQGSASVIIEELGMRYSLNLIDWPLQRGDTIESPMEALDAGLLQAPLVMRSWRPGDAYRPLGRRAVRKLKRMFLAARIPQAQRASWPVLTSQGKLAWVKGMPAAVEFAASPSTTRGLVIREERQ